MEDADIVELYFRRDQHALEETAAKYGTYLHRISMNVLGDREDAFRDMIEARAGRRFARRRTPFNQLRDWMKRKENEPEHL